MEQKRFVVLIEVPCISRIIDNRLTDVGSRVIPVDRTQDRTQASSLTGRWENHVLGIHWLAKLAVTLNDSIASNVTIVTLVSFMFPI